MRDLENQIVYGIEKICRLHKAVIEEKAKRAGISSLQVEILKFIYDGKGESLTEISGEFELSKATVSEAIKKLLEKGFLNRIRSKIDLRKQVLKLTEKGVLLIEELKLREHSIFHFFKEFDEENQHIFLNILKNILFKVSQSGLSKRIIFCFECKNFSKVDNENFYCLVHKKEFPIEEVRLNCRKFLKNKN